MTASLPVNACTISTLLFVFSALPMLTKAFRTRDLHSYSLGNIAVTNGGNIIHSLYVFSLPAGPIWILHSFYLVTYSLMLAWYLRYEHIAPRRAPLLPMREAGIALSEETGVGSVSPGNSHAYART